VLESVSVDSSGRMTASALSGRVEELGTIPLARFDDPEALIPVGETLYSQSFNSGIPSDVPGSGHVLQNVLELSNVDLSEQFVELIKFQRAFQINNRVVGTSDEIYQKIIDIKS
jgi:flagellar hook protein FlgE